MLIYLLRATWAASISAIRLLESAQDMSAASSAAVASFVVCFTCATKRINASSSSLGL
jgi:hypothetical protein